jgi:hypothetical protein
MVGIAASATAAWVPGVVGRMLSSLGVACNVLLHSIYSNNEVVSASCFLRVISASVLNAKASPNAKATGSFLLVFFFYSVVLCAALALDSVLTFSAASVTLWLDVFRRDRREARSRGSRRSQRTAPNHDLTMTALKIKRISSVKATGCFLLVFSFTALDFVSRRRGFFEDCCLSWS